MNAVARFSLLCGIVCAVVSITLYELFAPFIMRFFIADAETVALSFCVHRRYMKTHGLSGE